MLAQALTGLARSDAAFTRDGPRADVEYRDLGWAAASGGMIGAKHIRAIRPFEAETGWHWHDMSAHFVYVLQGWIEFRYAGVDEAVRVSAGASLSQPAGRRAQRRRSFGRPGADRDQRTCRLRDLGLARRAGRPRRTARVSARSDGAARAGGTRPGVGRHR